MYLCDNIKLGVITMIETYNKDVNMNFRVPKVFRDKLKKLADSQGTNVSQLFRNYMEDVLKGYKPMSASSMRAESPDVLITEGTSIHFRTSQELHDDFFAICKQMNKKPTGILRAYTQDYTRLHTPNNFEAVPFETTLVYLGIFLQNEMIKQGYAVASHDDRHTWRADKEYPVIAEIPSATPNTRLWRLYDSENKQVHDWLFRKLDIVIGS